MSSRPLIAKYPFDKTGTSLTNKVVGEIWEINTSRERAFVPLAGPFYTEGMVIYNNDTGKKLVPVDDYILCQPFQQASLRTGKDVECVVWIKLAAPITVRIEYQVVGGEYSWNIQALVDMINEIDLDGRPVTWGSVIGKPTAYPPAPHIHDIGDSYGWEYVVYQLEGIRLAILTGDEASHDELRAQMKSISDELKTLIKTTDDKVVAHIADKSNPHATTKAQVGLGSVENYPVASPAEALAGTLTNRYMTPALTTTLINRLVDEKLNAHIADKTNPHAVTKAQVGLGSVLNYGVATTAEAQAGAANDKYMTPALTKSAIMTLVGDAFNAHVGNMNNPHQTTKAQVGLSLVANYDVATNAEAQAGTATNKYMTPQATRAAVQTFAGDGLNNHIADKANPHATTKAQVGLGLVQNFDVATTAEAQAGTATNKYMTPQLTKAAITQAVGGAGIAAHLTDYNNPHRTTAAQVGLGNIPNAITRGRGVNSDGQLLTAGSMFDHLNSGDHDGRYILIANAAQQGSIWVTGSKAYVAVDGGWRQFWPATWNG